MDNKQIVAVLTAIAQVASQGKYTVDPEGARRMNAVFDAVASTINTLEKEDEVAAIFDEGDNDDS